MMKSTFSNVFENNVEHQEWLIEALRTGELTVNFTKADGTARAMKCTLDENIVPKSTTVKAEGTVERKKSPDVLAVYDTENSGWRSFRWDSIKSIVIEA